MSDPATNIDIEDVLASIRRLVLTGGPPGAAVMAAGPTPGRSRLVLTQAQRVEEVEEAGFEEPADEPAARAPLLVLSAPMALVEAPEARWSEPRALPEGYVESPGPEPTPERAPRANGRVAGARGIEAAVTGRAEAWDPDGSEEALDWSLGGVAVATEAFVFRHRAPTEGPPEAASRPRPEPERLVRTERPIEAEPDAVVGHRPARLTEPMFQAEDFAAPAEASAAARPVAPAPPAAVAVLVDEAQLRAIVTEVLRAEMAGELGERITRNVRKLVRREIFRVLEVREDD